MKRETVRAHVHQRARAAARSQLQERARGRDEARRTGVDRKGSGSAHRGGMGHDYRGDEARSMTRRSIDVKHYRGEQRVPRILMLAMPSSRPTMGAKANTMIL